MKRVVIAGISTRAAAESAARAGFQVTAIDAFADLDQHPAVRAISIPRPFSPDAAAGAAQSIECDAVVYLANFENHPDAVHALSAGRRLWGNAPDVLRRVRDPERLARALRERGIPAPGVRLEPDTTIGRVRLKPGTTIERNEPDAVHDREWLIKPLASGGGHAIRRWDDDGPIPDGCYLQERIAGTPGSMVFVAAGGHVVPLGISRQLVGDPAFGAAGYRYCGNILASGGADDVRLTGACAAARAIVEEFDLVGVNGIDFIERDGSLYPIEVNPRWTASMELVERACGLAVFALHAAACVGEALPRFDLIEASRGACAVGKAVVFAREGVTIGDPNAWIRDENIRDVPRPGETIRAGRPVCTVFATGRDDAECYAALVGRAGRVYSEMFASTG